MQPVSLPRNTRTNLVYFFFFSNLVFPALIELASKFSGVSYIQLSFMITYFFKIFRPCRPEILGCLLLFPCSLTSFAICFFRRSSIWAALSSGFLRKEELHLAHAVVSVWSLKLFQNWLFACLPVCLPVFMHVCI